MFECPGVQSLNKHMAPTVSYEIRYRLLKYVAQHPDATQRELASELGISLGKANYCLRALIEKGLVKVRNFRNSRSKTVYGYILTPRGLEEKINVTYDFLRRKVAEYDLLSKEIEQLTDEVRGLAADSRRPG
jgi:MarR family transcriptional regulator, temperature-dependent positive regulator of motility